MRLHLCSARLKAKRALIAAATDTSHAPIPTISLAAPFMTLAQLDSMSSHTWLVGGDKRMPARVLQAAGAKQRGARVNDARTHFRCSIQSPLVGAWRLKWRGQMRRGLGFCGEGFRVLLQGAGWEEES